MRVGDEVSAGSRLAKSATPARAPLYFEIRIGTDPVDPAEWFGI